MIKVFRVFGRGLQLLFAAGVLGWIAMAVHFQLAPPLATILHAALAVFALAVAGLALWRLWGGVWIAVLIPALAAGVWWSGLTPRQDRDWLPEVSRGVTADIAPGAVTVRNIRNFDWTSETQAVAQWYDLTVDPETITSVDMFLSVWDSPDIAHTLVSFGFADGQHIVFSGEIRKEQGEVFSTLGGFFRKFELVLIAADERDIVRLRTDTRGEQVSLYPVTLRPEQRRDLFMAFLDYGNDLAQKPRWYNTLLTNCTTMPYALVQRISDRVSLDRRIILSGRLPEYLFDLGVLPQGLTAPEIRARALLSPMGEGGADSKAFSARLRSNWTPL